MLVIVPSLLAMALLIILARLMAIYSSELFNSSEEILTTITNLSPRRRRFIEEVDRRPHGLLWTSNFLKSLTLIIGTGFALVIAAHIGEHYNWPLLPVAFLAVIAFWLVFTLVVDIIPPTGSSDSLQARLISHLGMVAIIYRAFAPLRRLAGVFWARYAEERIDEEKKEEIVERAIETLAEGIGTEEPIIEQDERQMIQQIFRLDTTEVREVMVPRINIVAVQPTITIEELRQIVREKGHSRFPVYENDLDTILGIIYAKDVFCSELAARDEFDARKFMRPPMLVPETQKIDQLLDELRRKRTHLAIVVDEYGGTAGLVSLEDIIEEIVGEIEDEHDPAKPAIIIQDDGAILVSGQVSLEEVTEHFDLRPFSEDFETVGGLIYDLVGSVPPVGRVLVKSPLRFTVLKMDGQRIAEVKIERLRDENNS